MLIRQPGNDRAAELVAMTCVQLSLVLGPSKEGGDSHLIPWWLLILVHIKSSWNWLLLKGLDWDWTGDGLHGDGLEHFSHLNNLY